MITFFPVVAITIWSFVPMSAYGRANRASIEQDVRVIKSSGVEIEKNTYFFLSLDGSEILAASPVGIVELDQDSCVGDAPALLCQVKGNLNPPFDFTVVRNRRFTPDRLATAAGVGAIAAVTRTGVPAGLGLYFGWTSPATAATIDGLAADCTTAAGFSRYLSFDERWMVELADHDDKLAGQIHLLASKIQP